VKISGHKEAS